MKPKICILFTLEDGELDFFQRIAIAKALIELTREFVVEKVDYEPPLIDWDVKDMAKKLK